MPSSASTCAEPGRLEPRRGVEPVAEREELERGHRLEHVDLGDERLEDLQDAVEQVQRRVGVAGLQRALDRPQLVAELLEPELVDLVDDDEQQLVVLGAVRAGGALDLEREQLRHLEVGRVRDGSAGHVARWYARSPQVRGLIRTSSMAASSSPRTSPSCGIEPSQRT